LIRIRLYSRRTRLKPVSATIFSSAMAAGCSVVSTDVGDVKSMVCEENRDLVVSREDEAGFSKALGRLVEDGSLRELLARKNREKAETNFSKAGMFQAYKNLYDSALKQ